MHRKNSHLTAFSPARSSKAVQEQHSDLVLVDKAFIRQQLMKVFTDVLKVSLNDIGGESAIVNCVENLWRSTIQYASGYNREVTKTSGIFKYDQRVHAMAAWMQPLEVRDLDIAHAVLSRPDLLYKNEVVIKNKFVGHSAWLKKIGIDESQAIKIFLKWPNITTNNEQSKEEKFFLALALTCAPSFKFGRNRSTSFESRRDWLLWDRPVATSQSTERYLLRKVFDELGVPQKPSTFIIRGSACAVEESIAKFLRCHTDSKQVPIPEFPKDPAESKRLINDLKSYTQNLVAYIQRNPGASDLNDCPRIMPLFVSDKRSLNRAKTRERLFAQMISVGLVQSYSIVGPNGNRCSLMCV